MAPIRLDLAERATLRKLANSNGICERRQLSSAHAQRFLRHGLLRQSPQLYHLTLRGQVEILRQRYRRTKTGTAEVTLSHALSVLSKGAVG